jgi:hypothetical protein
VPPIAAADFNLPAMATLFGEEPAQKVIARKAAFRNWCGEEPSFPREVAEAALAHVVGDKAERPIARCTASVPRGLEKAACGAIIVLPAVIRALDFSRAIGGNGSTMSGSELTNDEILKALEYLLRRHKEGLLAPEEYQDLRDLAELAASLGLQNKFLQDLKDGARKRLN